jgi:CHAT domain-containing protein
MARAREWDEVVDEVRALGFEGFLGLPSVESLLPAASGGPVIVLNVSRSRCDALIVSPGGVELVPLPGLTFEDARHRAIALLDVLKRVDDGVDELSDAAHDLAGGSPVGRARWLAATRQLIEARRSANKELTGLQQWMWQTIAAPVLDHLGLRISSADGEEWTRVWWCPTGPLAVMPLHAAQDLTAHPADHAAVIDRVVSSYTPTLRALQSAKAGIDPPNPDDRFLVVAIEETDGRPDLQGALAERDLLRTLLTPRRLTVLGESDASRADVLSSLAEHRWVHFGCHADQDLANPSQGGLLLSDGVLTIGEIAGHRFRGDFAGLAACKTAVGGVHLLDESITLAAALHFTGFRHVVASLWSIEDNISSTVFEGLYQQLIREGIMDAERSSLALHRAIREQRELFPDEPLDWAPFIHLGP